MRMEGEKKLPSKLKPRPGAPLVETDIRNLGDKHKILSPQEAVHAEREALLKKASACKIYMQDVLEEKERSLGPRLHCNEIIRRLREINPQIQMRDGTEGNIAIYRRKRDEEYDTEEFDPHGDPFFWHHKYMTGMPIVELPEWGYIDVDTSHLPTREHRGWRSVLIALIKMGAITYGQAIKEFGDPIHDRRSTLWYEQLARYMPN